MSKSKLWWGGLPVLVLSGLVLGCGQRTGSVSGTVYYQGTPLPGGVVSFVGSRGKAFFADVSESGTYTVAGLPTGSYKVTVDNSVLLMQERAPKPPAPKDGKAPEVPKKPGRYVPIPEQYRKSDSTSLNLTVQSGSHTQDIQLR